MQAARITSTTTKRRRQMVPTIDEQEEQKQAHSSANHRAPPGAAQATEPAGAGQQHSREVAAAAAAATAAAGQGVPPTTPTRYFSSLISRSSVLIHSLKQQYYSTSSGSSASFTSQAMHTSSIDSQSSVDSAQRKSSDEFARGGRDTRSEPGGARPMSPLAGTSASVAALGEPAAVRPTKPPLPPPPPQSVREATLGAGRTPSGPSKQLSLDVSRRSAGAGNRRHALLEQSLERDAALSLKVRDMHKHKRASSIKSALRHAHLGHLRVSTSVSSSWSGQHNSDHHHHHHHHHKDKSSSSGTDTGDSQVKSMPYELFEPPVTQRTFQRSRRRGAMTQDPKRQMSADTIGLRQLTDEYLQNAGLKPISSSGQCSLVALTAPSGSSAGGAGGGVGGGHLLGSLKHQDSSPVPQSSSQQQQQQCSNIEAQLFQASKHLSMQAGGGIGGGGCGGSQDSLSQVTILPGNLPWQIDVSIQCEILKAPVELEPYETTGDILNTIAGPYRPAPDQQHSGQLRALHVTSGGGGGGSFDSIGANQLSSTLKRKLTAISQHHHHLSPMAAAQTLAAAGSANSNTALNVVGNLKKSLSNTLDVGLLQATPYLHSQDSLPAYSSLKNESDGSASESETIASPTAKQLAQSQERAQHSTETSLDTNGGGSGLIGQLTSKIANQSSKKFSVSKKGLQRALSFDYRRYKRLEAGANQSGRPAASASTATASVSTPTSARCGNNLLRASAQQHNKSSLGLDQLDAGPSSPRPYLASSASQVDFQLPLLPYHKMQEAIVSQRLLGGGGGGGSAGHSASPSQMQLCAGEPPASASGEEDPPQAQPDADELLCGQSIAGMEPVAPQVHQEQQRPRQNERCARKPTPPRLVLDIPTIATHKAVDNGRGAVEMVNRETDAETNENNNSNNNDDAGDDHDDEYDDGGEDVCANEPDDSSRSTVIVCLPSPNIAIEPQFSSLPDASSALLTRKQASKMQYANNNGSSGGAMLHQNQHQQPVNFLSAQDIFSQSKSLIKRPSTMMAGSDEAMNQVVQAINNQAAAAAQNHSNQQQETRKVVRRDHRRQAIVPPRLATDASSSDAEGPTVGRLVDLGDDDDDEDDEDDDDRISSERDLDAEEDANMKALRRKRSGGRGHSISDRRDAANQNENRPSVAIGGGGGSAGLGQQNIPTFHIEHQDQPQQQAASDGDSYPAETRPVDESPGAAPRPDSQMTNVDSIVSSGSSHSIGKRAGDLTVTSPGGLTVSLGSLKGRRRSSIAVIPQMQICPGDLLVYSKQMIDRMNQNDSNDGENFLIDDKKGANKWSRHFKLCAQFDNKNQKARNELLCSLEDVLASLQPSTFADEQLSRYKGMNWNDFLIETGSRRSASTEALDNIDDDFDDNDNSNKRSTNQEDLSQLIQFNVTGQPVADPMDPANRATISKESVKTTMSTGSSQQAAPGNAAHRSRDTTVKSSLTSRFKEKPKLKRGQTVDSVFRIPLIPSSPLKHAQQHQQTPTAHLEDHDSLILEDDERSSPGASQTSREPSLSRRTARSSSTRSSRGSNRGTSSNRLANETTPGQPANEAGFTAECKNDLQRAAADMPPPPLPSQPPRASSSSKAMLRQSSLSTLSSTITRTEQKRQRALWDLFQSECTFFFDHLMTLKNVYMEPLKKIQVEGFAMFADPDVLFGNLDELCCGVYDFCKEFLFIIMRTLKTRPEELNATDVLIKLYKKNPKIDHLRAVYHRYTLNYINAITYLDSLRNQVEFTEFENWSSRDSRCKKLQLTDLLVAPVQHIMRVPIILKDIESHTENPKDRDEIRAILSVEEASLRELDDKMRWLKNFERLLEIQKNVVWPTVYDMAESKLIPECLREILTKQPIERLIVSPWRQIVHEGTLSSLDTGKPSDMHVILFDDMLLLTRRKKALTKKASTICKTNSGSSSMRDDGSFKYNVYKQPLSLDRFTVHDIDQLDAQAMGTKHMFVLVVMNRFQQFTNVHSFSAPNDDFKQTWMFKIRKTQERWQRNQLNTPSDQQQQLPTKQQELAACYSADNNAKLEGKQRKAARKSDSGQHSS